MKRYFTAILIAALMTAVPLSVKAKNISVSETGGAGSFFETVVEAESKGVAIITAGEWRTLEMDTLSGGAALSAVKPGATLEFGFNGVAVAADIVAGKSGGRMAVAVDGKRVATFDLYRGHTAPDAERMSLAGGLAPGAHRLRIEVLRDSNPESFGSLIAIDTLRAARADYGAVSGVLECKYNRGLPVKKGIVRAIGENYDTDVVTDATGEFAFSALPPGTYTLRFERPGFETLELSGLKVGSGQSMNLSRVFIEEKTGVRPLTYIRDPLGVRPVIVRPGDDFPVEVAAPGTISGWRAAIETPWAEWNLEPVAAVFNSGNGRWTLKFRVPAGVSPILYGLRLRFNSGEDYQPRAVMVVPEFKDSIRVVHLTDIHVYKSEMLFETYRQIADEVNLINPDVIVITGDLTDKIGYTDDRWPESDEYPVMLDLWNSYNAPTFILPGNHDLSPFKKDADYLTWNRFFDKTDFSFDVGGYHFTAFDDNYTMISSGKSAPYAEDIFPDRLDWMEQDLSRNAHAKMRILLFHVPLHNTSSKVKELASRYNVRLALYGHLHMNAVDKLSGTTYVQTGAAYDGFYRVLNLKNGELGEFNAKKDGISSFELGTVQSRTRMSDDGRSFTIQAKNSSVMDIPGASWRVEMPSAGSYACDGCTIVSRFPDGDKTLVIFTFDIPAKGVSTAVLNAR